MDACLRESKAHTKGRGSIPLQALVSMDLLHCSPVDVRASLAGARGCRGWDGRQVRLAQQLQ